MCPLLSSFLKIPFVLFSGHRDIPNPSCPDRDKFCPLKKPMVRCQSIRFCKPFLQQTVRARTPFVTAIIKASAITWNQPTVNFWVLSGTARNTRPVKNTLFSTKSPRLENGRSLQNWRFLDPFCKCVFSFVSTFSSVDHTKWPSGHPCPAGVI